MTMANRTIAAAALSGAAMLASAPAAATSFIGDTVTCDQVSTGSFSCFPGSTTVGAGTEFTTGFHSADPFLTFDLDSNSLTVDALRTGSLGGTIIELRNLTSGFSSFGFGGSTINGFDASDITIADGILRLNFIGTDFTGGNSASLSLTAVPEPTTWALMLLGFFGIGAVMRQKGTVRSTKVSFA